MHTFKNKNMSILDNCIALDIEKIKNNKDLILNATTQNDVIKIEMERSLKPLVNVGGWVSKLNLPILKKKISFSYNTKLLKSQIGNNYKPCS